MDAMDELKEHLSKRPLELRQAQEKGTTIIGYVPGGFMPEELVYAAGALPVGMIRGGNSNAVTESASYLPRWIDTFCRSQIGHYMREEDSLYRVIDLLIAPITDVNVRALADSFDFYTDLKTFRYGVPHDKEEDAIQYYLGGLHLFKEKLEQVTGNKMENEKLKEAIGQYNRMRELLNAIGELRKSEAPPISARDFTWLNHASYLADMPILIECLESIYDELKGKEGVRPRTRLLLIGSTMAMGDDKIFDLAEESGAAIVMEEFAEGMRHYWEPVKINGDPMQALCDRYFTRRLPPAWSRPTKERVDFFKKMAKEFSADGILWYQLMYRDGYDVQSSYFQKITEAEMGLRMLKVESDYDPVEVGPLRTRIETFIEMITI